MGKSLEQYVQEATSAYQPAYDAVQGQIDALPGQLEETNQQIDAQYRRRQANLINQRNQDAYAMSKVAGGNGGAFGGMGQIAAEKYNRQSFVPAVTQMNFDHSQDLANARTSNEQQRLALTNQLAQMQASARQQATQQYWAEQEAERNRALQQQQLAAQNAYYQYLMDAAKNQSGGYSLDKERNIYGGFNWYDGNGNLTRVGSIAANANNGDYNDTLAKLLDMAAQQGDDWSRQVLEEILNKGARFEQYDGGNTGNPMYDTLGIRRIG